MVLCSVRDFTGLIPSARAEALGITNKECHCVNDTIKMSSRKQIVLVCTKLYSCGKVWEGVSGQTYTPATISTHHFAPSFAARGVFRMQLAFHLFAKSSD